MAPEVSTQENADWGNGLEDVFIDAPLTAGLQSMTLYMSTPTSIDNAIGESVGALSLNVLLQCCLARHAESSTCQL